MQVRTESHEGPRVGSPGEVLRDFQRQTQKRQDEWRTRLRQEPQAFGEIEEQIDRHFRWAAGHFSAALLAELTREPALQQQVETVRAEAALPLKTPERRPLKLRLLCGLMLFVTTAYCAPRRKRGDEIEQPAGLYPELAALGFSKGQSPALQSRVARAVALAPSIEMARRELARQGLELDKKTVRRIAQQLGTELLVLRRRELLAWRRGELTPGTQLAGKRVAVQIDGGRIRIRKNKSGTGRGGRRPFTPEWREPKVLTLYEFDDHGRMKRRESFQLIEGTLLGPDHLAELVAFHLHRWGAAQAELVAFIADGAPWIWDRLEWIRQRAGLDPARTVHGLDFYHAAHHISLALKALGLPESERRSHYGRLRSLLKQSRWQKIVGELMDLARDEPDDSEVWREIDYLMNHGEAGHLRYRTFRRRGIPCGSGAVESSIRRVINLRLKNNATYWREEGAEALFAVRATILTERWDETLARVRRTMARDSRLQWHWEAPVTAQPKLKPEPATGPPQRQSAAGTEFTQLVP